MGDAMKSDTPETHTQGRLQLWTSNSWRRFCTQDGTPVCEPITQRDGHPDLHFRNGGENGPDARRLVACWNACEGFTTEAIEKGLDFAATKALTASLEVERQRDEAVECLREVLDLIEGYEDVADGSDGPRPNDAMHAGNAIRAVLSKYPKP